MTIKKMIFINVILNNELISKEIRIAALDYKDGTNKGKELHYIVHPVEVAMILQENHQIISGKNWDVNKDINYL
ncbi:MAG: hypothetical protein ACOCP8_09720 [archaeon]